MPTNSVTVFFTITVDTTPLSEKVEALRQRIVSLAEQSPDVMGKVAVTDELLVEVGLEAYRDMIPPTIPWVKKVDPGYGFTTRYEYD